MLKKGSAYQLPVSNINHRGYQFYAFPMSIISNYPESLPWIHSNFIQMCYDRSENSPVPFAPYIFDYAQNPWLITHKLDRSIYSIFNKDIIDFVRESIDRDYYVYLNVDEFFIPNRNAFQNYNYSHDILIFGYDEVKGVFNVLGYDHNYEFKKSEVSYQNFKAAFNNIDSITNYCNQIYLYKYNPDGKYTFNFDLVIDLIEDYLYSHNTSSKFYMVQDTMDRAYGMKSYMYLKKYLADLLVGKSSYDIRNLHCLLEHKIAMQKRIEFFESEGYIDTSYNLSKDYIDIQKKALDFRNMMIKSGFDKNPKRIEQIIDALDTFKLQESEILERLIQVGKEHRSNE
ncbi:hypothetical protein [Bacillus pseudomycoides]|uniref:Uncharacterized protein n=1 Tax=Bacillus pseudomycoides TaxID=64104 RepID=A0A2C3VR50_9BACI|nr:hypothetical protein [Bacillus pseudomycoides]PEA82339.1 hypothetical protein CON99_17710 [Bacillus pseudomycoides]PED73219.1 hypothetical protein CON97_04780 [Bacillus pseudomycoides]PEI43670.1 hypothetical protein CN620_07230 [Bacillus pseudomycoides]PEJ80763.1 hypothetical protein CN680_06430 [Bacillus pseudomycoides]PEM15981.1 hypothetical protein CN628_15055 [Bacillus pseudomycoides]